MARITNDALAVINAYKNDGRNYGFTSCSQTFAPAIWFEEDIRQIFKVAHKIWLTKQINTLQQNDFIYAEDDLINKQTYQYFDLNFDLKNFDIKHKVESFKNLTKNEKLAIIQEILFLYILPTVESVAALSRGLESTTVALKGKNGVFSKINYWTCVAISASRATSDLIETRNAGKEKIWAAIKIALVASCLVFDGILKFVKKSKDKKNSSDDSLGGSGGSGTDDNSIEEPLTQKDITDKIERLTLELDALTDQANTLKANNMGFNVIEGRIKAIKDLKTRLDKLEGPVQNQSTALNRIEQEMGQIRLVLGELERTSTKPAATIPKTPLTAEEETKAKERIQPLIVRAQAVITTLQNNTSAVNAESRKNGMDRKIARLAQLQNKAPLYQSELDEIGSLENDIRVQEGMISTSTGTPPQPLLSTTPTAAALPQLPDLVIDKNNVLASEVAAYVLNNDNAQRRGVVPCKKRGAPSASLQAEYELEISPTGQKYVRIKFSTNTKTGTINVDQLLSDKFMVAYNRT